MIKIIFHPCTRKRVETEEEREKGGIKYASEEGKVEREEARKARFQSLNLSTN